jgi:hypothetical protein
MFKISTSFSTHRVSCQRVIHLVRQSHHSDKRTEKRNFSIDSPKEIWWKSGVLVSYLWVWEIARSLLWRDLENTRDEYHLHIICSNIVLNKLTEVRMSIVMVEVNDYIWMRFTEGRKRSCQGCVTVECATNGPSFWWKDFCYNVFRKEEDRIQSSLLIVVWTNVSERWRTLRHPCQSLETMTWVMIL